MIVPRANSNSNQLILLNARGKTFKAPKTPKPQNPKTPCLWIHSEINL